MAVVETKKSRKKSYVGQVVSDAMDKTIVVAITTKKMNPLYKKFVKWTKKVKAHDEKNEAHVGDTVKVVECRPLSKEKCWRLASIVERAR